MREIGQISFESAFRNGYAASCMINRECWPEATLVLTGSACHNSSNTILGGSPFPRPSQQIFFSKNNIKTATGGVKRHIDSSCRSEGASLLIQPRIVAALSELGGESGGGRGSSVFRNGNKEEKNKDEPRDTGEAFCTEEPWLLPPTREQEDGASHRAFLKAGYYSLHGRSGKNSLAPSRMHAPEGGLLRLDLQTVHERTDNITGYEHPPHSLRPHRATIEGRHSPRHAKPFSKKELLNDTSPVLHTPRLRRSLYTATRLRRHEKGCLPSRCEFFAALPLSRGKLEKKYLARGAISPASLQKVLPLKTPSTKENDCKQPATTQYTPPFPSHTDPEHAMRLSHLPHTNFKKETLPPEEN
ncbi:hypothetical protein cyc_03576 [Cyclospora cayetanensis]|uniref:Uncharacterized protein n=1 Tax=Cyclospora cayetanensis TaxID=88456 RepID=A0A1D3D1Z3_9EIME|nr:hypothetical protein cyc_03576 [Cyclospora cayetanensis]